jgi:Secretion system C-terminal sorting domain
MKKVFTVILLLLACKFGLSTVYTVTNTNDTGSGSMRTAITSANSNSGLDTIKFNISGTGPFTIKPITTFPDISDSVFIDGFSQSSSSRSSTGNHTIMIEFDGSSISLNSTPWSQHCFDLIGGTDGSRIRGVSITYFPGSGINIGANVKNILIESNFIGLDAAGLTGKGNLLYGIVIRDGDTITIGGSTRYEANTISGNGIEGTNYIDSSAGNGYGIEIKNSAKNVVVENNFIGTNPAGTAIVATSSAPGNDPTAQTTTASNRVGVSIRASGVLIKDNIIANIATNINISSTSRTDSNTIIGNYIGLQSNGTSSVTSDAKIGIYIWTGRMNTIGGSAESDRNYISVGNSAAIVIKGDANTIEGNYIGTDTSGKAKPSGYTNGNARGIDLINGADSNQVLSNIIGYSKYAGINIYSDYNIVRSNYIGVDTKGNNIANKYEGLRLRSGANNNLIGGKNGGNTIVNNITPTWKLSGGLTVEGTAKDNPILDNVIYNTGPITGTKDQLAVDLNIDGVTLNDAGDTDTGPNNQLNYPEIQSLGYSGGNMTITFYLDVKTTGLQGFRVQFYDNTTPDPTGHGEMESLVHTFDMTTATYTGDADSVFTVIFSSASSLTNVFAVVTEITDYSNRNSTDPATIRGSFRNTSEMGLQSLILPIPWLSFQITGNDCQPILEWSFNQPGEFNDFTLQVREANGEFRDIQTIDVSGKRSDQVYIELNNPQVVSYFRIKSADLNGEIQFSEIKSFVNPCGDLSYDFQVFPNPASNSLTVQFMQNQNNLFEWLIIMNSSGSIVYKDQLKTDRQIKHVDISNLNPGLYLINLMDIYGKLHAKRIVIQ